MDDNTPYYIVDAPPQLRCCTGCGELKGRSEFKGLQWISPKAECDQCLSEATDKWPLGETRSYNELCQQVAAAEKAMRNAQGQGTLNDAWSTLEKYFEENTNV
jgi:O6-methylguanine-DNA--protein-cysteine methyltransferase